MPVKSSHSSLLVWPTADRVIQFAAAWARQTADEHTDIHRIGYFGSYATGRSGVGSDLDLVIVIEQSNQPFARRAASWDTTTFPVPVDLIVYTVVEWDAFTSSEIGFARTLRHETRWLYPYQLPTCTEH